MMIFQSIITDSFPHHSASARPTGWGDDLPGQLLSGRGYGHSMDLFSGSWMKRNLSGLSLSRSSIGQRNVNAHRFFPAVG